MRDFLFARPFSYRIVRDIRDICLVRGDDKALREVVGEADDFPRFLAGSKIVRRYSADGALLNIEYPDYIRGLYAGIAADKEKHSCTPFLNELYISKKVREFSPGVIP